MTTPGSGVKNSHLRGIPTDFIDADEEDLLHPLDLADDRLLIRCPFCNSGRLGTRDHNPSKVFLDPPLPEQLPIIECCNDCNNGFSRDEPYTAALIEAFRQNSDRPTSAWRRKIRSILKNDKKLQHVVWASLYVDLLGQRYFLLDHQKLRRVGRKLAIGHLAFEFSERGLDFKMEIGMGFLSHLDGPTREGFLELVPLSILPEIGCRSSQRIIIIQPRLSSDVRSIPGVGLCFIDWIEIQAGRYQYLPFCSPDYYRIKIIISETFFFDVIFSRD